MDQASGLKCKSRGKSYPGLALNSSQAMPTDNILIAGFVGRSLDLMFVDGKVYGTMVKEYPDKLKSCMFNEPQDSANKVTCNFFTEYPTYKVRKLQVGVNNIGPGFSGSPVLKDGKVVGIVSRYFTPNTASGYYNGDVIFFPINDIIEVLKASEGNMMSINGKDYDKRNQIYEFDESIRDFYSEVEGEMNRLVRELLKKDE